MFVGASVGYAIGPTDGATVETLTRNADLALYKSKDRGGNVELLLPYATIEPIRDVLLQMFMGEKFGRDNIWEGHLATELWTTQMEVRCVLDELQIPLQRLLDLQVGETTPPFGSITDGVRVLVVCGRDDPTSANAPNPDQIMAQLEEERVNKRARIYLRDLRRDAVIDYN